MSGPAYPPGPLPGSNGIGPFTIGISPIGTIEAFDVWRTIISQYANSPILTEEIENINVYLDQTQNFDAFYDYIWNVATAQGAGLDIWGRIVGINRVLEVQVGDWFGFEEAQPGTVSFGFGAFYSGTPITENYALSDDAYRQLIFAKAAANITDGSIPAINQILLGLFPNRGNVYVTDGQQIGSYFGFQEAINSNGFNQAAFYAGQPIATMTMQYVFDFDLSPLDLAIAQSGVLPKPVGVEASIVIL